MANSISRTQRRLGVLLNYLALTVILLFSFFRQNSDWNNFIIFGLLSALAVVIFTLFRYHILTGLWKLTHTGYNNLDERQIQITHQALSTSYSIFTVVCLLIFLGLALFQSHNINLIITFAVLLYMAHTLPATIIAWNEKEI